MLGGAPSFAHVLAGTKRQGVLSQLLDRRQKPARMITAQRTIRGAREASPHEDHADADLIAFIGRNTQEHVCLTWRLQRFHPAVIEWRSS
jgi:hypothetical protein